MRLLICSIVCFGLAGCSSFSVDVRSISFAPAGTVKTVTLGTAKVTGNALAESLGPDLLHYIGFSLEQRGVRLVESQETPADLHISAELRFSKISIGLDDRYSLVIDTYIARNKVSAARVFTVCTSDLQFSSGASLISIAEDIADEILSVTLKD